MANTSTSKVENDAKPLVAIVGRPNVGKSTLFNRLLGERTAVVFDSAGTTRDRITSETVWGDHPFILVDTGGLEISPETELWEKVKAQVAVAIEDSDLIIMLVDAETGPLPADREVANLLRTVNKPILLAVNKADNEQREMSALEFYELGINDLVPISAYHNKGVDVLMDLVVKRLPSIPTDNIPEADIRLAIVGRTNVGKSTLINAITGEDRAIVSDIPGTTRDALDTLTSYDGKSVLLVDTAGIRRRGSIAPGVERYSVLRSIRAIERSDVAILLMDTEEIASGQDAHIASYVINAYRGIVLGINKWDEAAPLGISMDDAIQMVQRRFKFAHYAPLRFLSATRGTGLKNLMNTVYSVHKEWSKGVPRYGLRRTVLDAVSKHPPALSGRRSLKIYGVTQDQTSPPSFTFYVNRSDLVHFSYVRYLENTLRAKYGFEGSRLRMRFKGRGET